MKLANSVVVLFFFFNVLAQVAPWTIDLPEVRKYFFRKHGKDIDETKNKYEDYLNRGQIFHSNARDNALHTEKQKYAEDFGYQSYMEKKVAEIVHDGSAYLEGLRRSLEEFKRFLEECNTRNVSMPENLSVSNSTLPQPAMSNSATMLVNTSEVTVFNNSNSSTVRLGMNPRRSCREVTEASERVRRYTELAVWVTRRLQDLSYAEKYQKTDQYEENELILKLAWFLDQLATLTGYLPVHKQYLPSEAEDNVTTTSPAPITLVPQTEELKKFLINCVKANSTIPATVRCQYTLPLPELVQRVVNVTSTLSPQLNSNVAQISALDNDPQQSMEILVAADDFRTPHRLAKRSPVPDEYYIPIPVHEKPKPIVDFIVKKLTNLKEIVKTVKKHAVADFASQIAIHKHIHKRSIDDNSVPLNRLSIISELNVKDEAIVKSVGTVVKSDEATAKLDKEIVKSDEDTVKSDEPVVKSDESIIKTNKASVGTNNGPVESNKSTVKDTPIHYPMSDASIVNTKSFKKRSIDEKALNFNTINQLSYYKSLKPILTKRSVDDPFMRLANYYMKYKVWDNSNPLPENIRKNQLNFDVNNNLQTKVTAKRSLFYKKNNHLSPKSLRGQNLQHKNLPKKVKTNLIRNLLEKKRKKVEKELHKVSKRSLIYEHMYLPRIPSNPMGDISYYVKNKERHMSAPSLFQAAQPRAGLQQSFLTGNIEVVRRYGANYNPAVPNAFLAGMLKDLASI